MKIKKFLQNVQQFIKKTVTGHNAIFSGWMDGGMPVKPIRRDATISRTMSSFSRGLQSFLLSTSVA